LTESPNGTAETKVNQGKKTAESTVVEAVGS